MGIVTAIFLLLSQGIHSMADMKDNLHSMQEHEATWHGFLALCKYTSIAIILLLLLLAWWLI